MSFLQRQPQWIGSRLAASAGNIQDKLGGGELVLGYFLVARGLSTDTTALDPIADLAQWRMSSQAVPNLATEFNMGFLAGRTRNMTGSTQWLNQPSGADEKMNIQFFHSFDLARGKHSNVFPAQAGEIIDIYLPPIPTSVMQAGSYWDCFRVTVDRADAFYCPTYQSRVLNLSEGRWTFAGKTAGIQFQHSDGDDPGRISVFPRGIKRHYFMDFADFIGWTGLVGHYAPDEVLTADADFFTDDADSVRKCLGLMITDVEATQGTGDMSTSQCILVALPQAARDIASISSGQTERVWNDHINAAGPDAVSASIALRNSTFSSIPDSAIVSPGADDAGDSFNVPINPDAGAATFAPVLAVQPPVQQYRLKTSWASRVVKTMGEG